MYPQQDDFQNIILQDFEDIFMELSQKALKSLQSWNCKQESLKQLHTYQQISILNRS